MPSVDNPNSFAASLPGQIAQLRKDLKDLSANSVYSPSTWHVGAGGLIVDGTSALTGATTLTGGVTGPLAATGAVSAGADVVAAGNVTATAGNITATAGIVTGTGGIISADARSRTGGSGLAGLWADSSGRFQINPSSIRFKTDIEVWNANPARLLQLRSVMYRLLSQPADAAKQPGFIAEELLALGFPEFIFYNADNQVEGINYDRMVVVLLELAKLQDARITAIEKTLASSSTTIPTV